MRTLEILLFRGDGQPPHALDAPLAKEAERIVDGLPKGTTTRVAHNLLHHRDAALKARDSLEGLDELLEIGLPPAGSRVPLKSFDAVLEVSVPGETDPQVLIDVIDGLVHRLGAAVDPSRSAAVLGTDHLIIDGSGAVELFYCLRRVPAITHDQFCDFWLNQLVKHTTKTPGKSAYRQLHADPPLTVRAAEAAGVEIDNIDGVALEWYPNLASFRSAVDWADQDYAPVIEAENKMSDFTGARAMLSYAHKS